MRSVLDRYSTVAHCRHAAQHPDDTSGAATRPQRARFVQDRRQKERRALSQLVTRLTRVGNCRGSVPRISGRWTNVPRHSKSHNKFIPDAGSSVHGPYATVFRIRGPSLYRLCMTATPNAARALMRRHRFGLCSLPAQAYKLVTKDLLCLLAKKTIGAPLPVQNNLLNIKLLFVFTNGDMA
jgi:hypothetical protein